MAGHILQAIPSVSVVPLPIYVLVLVPWSSKRWADGHLTPSYSIGGTTKSYSLPMLRTSLSLTSTFKHSPLYSTPNKPNFKPLAFSFEPLGLALHAISAQASDGSFAIPLFGRPAGRFRTPHTLDSNLSLVAPSSCLT